MALKNSLSMTYKAPMSLDSHFSKRSKIQMSQENRKYPDF